RYGPCEGSRGRNAWLDGRPRLASVPFPPPGLPDALTPPPPPPRAGSGLLGSRAPASWSDRRIEHAPVVSRSSVWSVAVSHSRCRWRPREVVRGRVVAPDVLGGRSRASGNCRRCRSDRPHG